MSDTERMSRATIFLSYRRGDSAGFAGRLFDALVQDLGKDRVFRDIDTIPAGAEFSDVITHALGSCVAAVVVIGPDWLSVANADGRRRLDDPRDFVRMEVAAALARGIPVVPVLVGGAPLPDPAHLPADLAPLVGHQAYELSDLRWQYDVGRLLKQLRSISGIDPHRFRRFLSRQSIPVLIGLVALLLAGIGTLLLELTTERGTTIEQATTAAGDAHDAAAPAEDDAADAEVPEGGEILDTDIAQVRSLSFSPDGRTLSAAGYGGSSESILLWDVKRQQEIKTLQVPDDLDEVHASFVRLAFSGDGKTVAIADGWTSVALFDVAATQVTHRFSFPQVKPGTLETQTSSVALSPDGDIVALGANDGLIHLWQVTTGRSFTLHHDGANARSLAFSPDGSRFAAAIPEGTVSLWETRSWQPDGSPLGERIEEPKRHGPRPIAKPPTPSWLLCAAFSPDGRILVTGHNDGKIWLWDLATRQRVGSALDYGGAVGSVAFSLDGRMLAAVGDLDVTRIWNVEDRSVVGVPLPSPDEILYSVAFSPDRKLLAIGGVGGVFLWNLEKVPKGS